ncbi:MAG TPA: FAD-dependent oxidoreductase, partial [Erysipelothrix sp.]|nr:FAD-dependent oxidoreductase [Erysipelothrix sp.]
MKTVVVGCTHAGTSAVKSILNTHPDMEVVVFERNDNVSFLSCGIALYIGEVVKEAEELFYSSPQELAELGAQVNMEHNVLELDEINKKVTVQNMLSGEIFEETYDKLVLTTGSWPIEPPIPGIEAENILLCKNYEQAQEIFNRKQDAKNVVIVGGGYIGIELVEAFHDTGKNVTLIDGLDRVLNKYLDKEITDILENDFREKGITLALDQTVESFSKNDDGSVKTVHTPLGDFEADLVIMAVGFRPNSELVEGKLDLLPNGAVKVNKYMQTSNPDIYAAGDNVAVHYNPTGDHSYIPLATNAVRMGTLVGLNILEDKVAYRGTQGTSGLYLFGFNIGSTGLTVESAKHFGIEVDSVVVEDN